MSNNPQIFQTNSALRWKSIQWTARIILSIIIVLITVTIIAIVRGQSPDLPNINTKNSLYKSVVDPIKKNLIDQSPRKYKGFKNFLEAKDKEDSLQRFNHSSPLKTTQFIRAAFYSPAANKEASLNDLATNGQKLNTIFPEWFFINHNNVVNRIDIQGFNLMKKQGLKILPMLTNFNSATQDFDGALVHEILNNIKIQDQFINALADTLTKYQLQGINIDFEALVEKDAKPITNFQKNLYQVFHQKGLLVTQDVIPMNDDYNYNELKSYNDYIVLMAYDQHSDAQSGPGPIAAQKWIEQALDEAANKMESNKIIVAFASYGYDWSMNNKGQPLLDENHKPIAPTPLTFAQALDKASITHSKVIFDNDNFNSHFSYEEVKDDDTTYHTVWFNSATAMFNSLRFTDEYGTAGTAFWVMGKEDPRIWNFYDRSLTNAALAKNPFDFGTMQALPYNTNQLPTKIGEGELLRILYTPQKGSVSIEVNKEEQLITEENYLQLPTGYVYEKFGEDTTPIGPKHKIILTFDDGPDPRYTPAILSILEKEKVPATFFVVGINAENNIPLLQRIYKDGFEIGNHTFTHGNIAKMSINRAALEMKSTRLLIEAVTGRSTILFRAPYNADSEPQTFEEIEPIARSKTENYITIGESIDPNDWDDTHVNADSIFNRIVRIANEGRSNIILLHDAGGNTRQATVDALPRIIEYFKTKGCEFTTVANLMGKTKDDVMPIVKRDFKLQLHFYFTIALYWVSHFIFALFIVGIILSISRTIVMAALAYLQLKKQRFIPDSTLQPGVSIIVPAYNEEINAIRTVESLLQQNYPNLQIVFVDDGSKDSTYERVHQHFLHHKNVIVVTKQNGGKATALNYGINLAIHDYVVCIDADTQLKKDAITQLMKKFYNAVDGMPVGAVAGNVKVGNEVNMITKWQSIEYTTSQNFDRAAFDYLNCITVVPGAIGAFNKTALIKAGGFTTDTLAEDCDLTMRLHKIGYSVRNCREAISYTEAPETFKQFLKQRFRWSFGVMQCFWKHRNAFLNPTYKNFGMVALPYMLMFQMILPFLAPLADIILVLSLLAAGMGIIPASLGHIISYYFIFTLVDMACAAIAFSFENAALQHSYKAEGRRTKESYKKLLWLFPQQLVYRQMMYYILIKSFSKALKGELQGWGVLKRTGNVKQTITV
ncbi:glycosyltransferase [Ferruginibacter yonginensis]|uniref:Glycosyltransferase n=1 Tax=Ferruginibacter yonginensis TaxID=1310416 RepID=A0ABV8QSE8_9BACT